MLVDLLEEFPSHWQDIYEELVVQDASAFVEDGEWDVKEIPHPDLHVLEDGAGWGAGRSPRLGVGVGLLG